MLIQSESERCCPCALGSKCAQLERSHRDVALRLPLCARLCLSGASAVRYKESDPKNARRGLLFTELSVQLTVADHRKSFCATTDTANQFTHASMPSIASSPTTRGGDDGTPRSSEFTHDAQRCEPHVLILTDHFQCRAGDLGTGGPPRVLPPLLLPRRVAPAARARFGVSSASAFKKRPPAASSSSAFRRAAPPQRALPLPLLACRRGPLPPPPLPLP